MRYSRRLLILVLALIPAFSAGDDVTTSSDRQACWEQLIDDLEKVGFDRMRRSEQVYFLVQYGDAVVNNDGFHGICVNPVGEYGTRFADAFRAIGASKKAAIFDDLNDVFGERGLPEDFWAREDAHSRLSKSEVAKIDALDDRYYGDEESVDQLVTRWVESEELCR